MPLPHADQGAPRPRHAVRLFPGRSFFSVLSVLLLLPVCCQDPEEGATPESQAVPPDSDAAVRKPGAQTLREAQVLRFSPDRTFTIVQFTDTQDDQEMDPRTVRLIEAVLDDVGPDLVVFTGDNVRSGPKIPQDVWTAIDQFARPVDSRGISWLIAFGNHDEDHTPLTGVDEEKMLEYCMSFPFNVNQPGPTGVHGTGNMHALVLESDGDQPRFTIWALDSNRYVPDTIAGQAIRAAGLRAYDWIRHSQVNWYYQTSRELEARYGRPVPGLMFLHIPLPELDLMWKNPEVHGVVGEKNEDVAAGAFNSGLFAAIMERGDVRGVFVGHDHVNDYAGDYFGIRLGYAANTGYGTYGLDGDEGDRMRGARVFVVHEDDPGRFETYMIWARDLGM
jgi:hypothetical protein